MKKWVLPFALVLAVGVLCSWRWLGWQTVKAEVRHKFPMVPRLQTGELAAWIADRNRPRPLLLDVREPAEFAFSHLAGARRVDPAADPARLADLPKDQPIVAYCSVGYRSAQFAERLRQAGFTDVYNLEGSIFQWAGEDRPLSRDGQPVKQVHPYSRTWGLLLRPELRAPVPANDVNSQD